MSKTTPKDEVTELRRRLEEAEETLRAIQSGEVDALVVESSDGAQVYTLQGADHSYRMLIEAMQQGAATLSSHGTVLYCNRSFGEILRSPLERVIGASITRFLPPSQHPLFEELLEQSQTGRSQTELLFRAEDKSLRPVHLALNPFALLNGSAVFLIATDLTEQKKHQDLQEVNRRKDEFLAMLAHELRNPLAPILNAVTLLNHLTHKDEKLAFASEVIERQTQHLARLVDDLLDMSRISLGKVKLQKERLELATVVARAVETSRPIIDARKHQLTLRLPPQGVRLEADPTRLAQVISNLLSNAAKYTEEGGAVSLTTEREGDEIVIRVRDTGIGIPAELLPSVFELFTQGDRSLARSEGGLGIGLTLVRRLVELHDGTVEAISEGPGHGSEFVVRLPALGEEKAAAHYPATPSENGHGRGHFSVLVVDDNQDGANILAMLLKMLGHQVTVAYTGPEALELAQAMRPRLVLLDIGLPEMSGYDVARCLREMPGYETTTLVAMTGYGQDEDKRRSREAGFDHHLVKPVDFNNLKGLLDSLGAVEA